MVSGNSWNLRQYLHIGLFPGESAAVTAGRLLKVRENAATREQAVGLAEDKVLNSFGTPPHPPPTWNQSQSKTPASDLRAAW